MPPQPTHNALRSESRLTYELKLHHEKGQLRKLGVAGLDYRVLAINEERKRLRGRLLVL